MQRHSFTALNSTFVVDAEYQFVKELGQGAYGCVVAAKHRRTGEGCAIKKITNINTKVCVYFHTCVRVRVLGPGSPV
jgi:serine/threonine protein kinase